MAVKAGDNEDAATRLGDSEILRIKHPPASQIPDVGKGLEHRLEVLAIVAREQAHDIFKADPRRLYFAEYAYDFPEQTAALAVVRGGVDYGYDRRDEPRLSAHVV